MNRQDLELVSFGQTLTASEVLNVIDGCLSNDDAESKKLARVISAVRGVDVAFKERDAINPTTTAVIRANAFPQTFLAQNGKGKTDRTVNWDMVQGDTVVVPATTPKPPVQFIRHIKNAAETLGLTFKQQ
jgi:hypothetical protein